MPGVMYSYWKRHSGALGRAVLLSLAAGTLFMGSAYAKDYTSPITMDYETDYGDNDVKGDYHDVLTRDNSNPKIQSSPMILGRIPSSIFVPAAIRERMILPP